MRPLLVCSGLSAPLRYKRRMPPKPPQHPPPPETLTLSPIGVIRTPFRERYQTPIQPVPGVGGRKTDAAVIELYPGHNYEQALDDLAGFERIWVISWLHVNKGWRPKVLPPRGPKERRGVFATRSPHRPCPIAISAARLLKVDGLRVEIAESDLLDGTPILDLKPYLPYADAFPDSRIGWLEEVVAAEGRGTRRVVWSTEARAQAEWLRAEFGIDLAQHAELVLGRDPSPHPYRRVRERDDGALELAWKSWRVIFRVSPAPGDTKTEPSQRAPIASLAPASPPAPVNGEVLIERLSSGYAPEALSEGGKDAHEKGASSASKKPLHQPEAHRAFIAKWGAK